MSFVISSLEEEEVLSLRWLVSQHCEVHDDHQDEPHQLQGDQEQDGVGAPGAQSPSVSGRVTQRRRAAPGPPTETPGADFTL